MAVDASDDVILGVRVAFDFEKDFRARFYANNMYKEGETTVMHNITVTQAAGNWQSSVGATS